MSIITISRGSYSRGKEVAEKVAQKLGYECIARDVLLEASGEFNVPETKLIHAIQDAPSFLDRLTYGKEKYVAYIQSALLGHFRKDNIVYHGLAGHFFVKGVPHVLKVRVIADMEDRIKLVMDRDRVSRKKALNFLSKIDEQRRKWSKSLYGIDTLDPSLYDMVLHIRKITVDDAVDIICHTIGLKDFVTTPESQKIMDDLFLASEVKVALIDLKPDIEVSAKNGKVSIQTSARLSQEKRLVKDIEGVAKTIPGVKDVSVHIRLDPMETYD
ncbi:MAG: cytidylate kinase family protein [Pseudomonadota bacterium]